MTLLPGGGGQDQAGCALSLPAKLEEENVAVPSWGCTVEQRRPGLEQDGGAGSPPGRGDGSPIRSPALGAG